MIDSYVGLHRHSSYSLLDGFGRGKQIAERLVDIGQTACALTDHGSIFGHAEFYHELTKRQIKPILGCEFYHHERMRGNIDQIHDRNKLASKRADICHLTVLARNAVGYQNLLRLVTKSWAEGYHYTPGIDWNELIRHQEGLVVLSGCVIGQLSKLINNGKPEIAHQWINWLKERIENFYIEIVPCPGLGISQKACVHLWEIAKELKVPTIITDDAHFPCASDHAAEDAMLCVQQGKTYDDTSRKIRLDPYHYYCTSEEILDRAQQVLMHVPRAELEAACRRSLDIAATCNVELPKSKGPMFQVPENSDPLTLLFEWIQEGKAYRRSLGLLPPEDSPEWKTYLHREGYELDIIHHHNFENYFLIVGDLVRWMNKHGKWCIARGSAGGSLTCFYLGITQIDPVKFDLPVERFIDYSRPDLPDIDLDCDSRYRNDCFNYLREKYGADHCAHVAALGTYRARQSIRDIGKVFKVPGQVIEKLLKFIPEKPDVSEGLKATGQLQKLFDNHPDIQPILTKYPKLRLAAELEGQLRTSSIHAAGFVVDSRPLYETVAIVGKPDSATKVISVDKDYAADQGLLKIDCLSVDMYAVIAEVLEMIGKDCDWLYRLPLDDRPTYEMLAAGNNMGVFQLQGTTAGRVLTQLQAETFNELVTISAIARPGPLQSGGTQEYIDRKHGRIPTREYHPAIQTIVAETYGCIIYQEQVMRVAREVGRMEWKDVHKIRKLVSKSGGENALKPYEEKLIEGALAQDIPEDEVRYIWRQCLKAGAYLFNQGHCKQYAQVGYWTAYLKAHFPAQFTCVYARYEKDDTRRAQMFQEFRRLGGKFLLLDPNRSQVNFSVVDEKTILGGFSNIRGIGEAMAQELVRLQPYRDWDSFLKVVPPGIRSLLYHCNISEQDEIPNSDVILTLAPWFIEIHLTDYEKERAKYYCCQTIGTLPDILAGTELTSVRFCGRVTAIELTDLAADAKKYNREPPKAGEFTMRAAVTIADETGVCSIHFSNRTWGALSKGHALIVGPGEGIGNTWIVEARISEDRQRLFADNAINIRVRATEDLLTPGVAKAQPRMNEPELREYEARLQFEKTGDPMHV